MKKLIFILTLSMLLAAFSSCDIGEEIETGTETNASTENDTAIESVLETDGATETETDEVTTDTTETVAETEAETETVPEELILPSMDSVEFWIDRNNIFKANLQSDALSKAVLKPLFPKTAQRKKPAEPFIHSDSATVKKLMTTAVMISLRTARYTDSSMKTALYGMYLCSV